MSPVGQSRLLPDDGRSAASPGTPDIESREPILLNSDRRHSISASRRQVAGKRTTAQKRAPYAAASWSGVEWRPLGILTVSLIQRSAELVLRCNHPKYVPLD
jgi:hypothetical protein